MSSTYPHNTVNFGPLAAEIFSLVWGTPANFNGFRVPGSVTALHLVVGVSQTVALNRGRHVYSAGRPSRWALAHISSLLVCEIFGVFLTHSGQCNGFNCATLYASIELAGLCDRRDTSKTVHSGDTETTWSLH